MVDLFINGILERSMDLKNNMPIFDISDSFIIGRDKQGIFHLGLIIPFSCLLNKL